MKKSVKIIIAILAVLIVLGGIFAGIFFSGLFDYMKPARKAWNSQVQKALGLDGVKVTDYSETLEDYKDVMQKPFTAKFDVTANLSISELDKDVQKIINNSKIKVETSAIPNDSFSQTKVTLEADNSKVLDLDVVTNKTKVGITSQDIYDKYLAASLDDLQEYTNKNTNVKNNLKSNSKVSSVYSTTSSQDFSKIFDGLSKLNSYELLYISKNDLKDLQKSYKKAFDDSIDKDCYTKKANVKVEVDGKDVGTTGYYLTLSGEDAYDLVKGLISETKSNDTIKSIITEKANMVLEAIGEDKIDAKAAEEMLNQLADSFMEEFDYNTFGGETINESKKLKEIKDKGIQIAVYSKLSKPVRLEVNYINDMDDIYSGKTLLSIEYAKKKDIYTVNINEESPIVITDEYDKKSSDERKGTLTVEVKSTKLGTIDYEFIDKKSEKKIALNANVPLLSLKLNLEISEKGNIKKEPVDILVSIDGTYKKQSAKIKIEGTVDYTNDVSIPTLSSSNSVDIMKLSSKEQTELTETIMKKASEVLPARLKLLGINVKAEDIYSPKKTTTTTTTTSSSAASSKNTMKNADDKLVAKKAENDDSLGKYTQIIEIGFKDKKIIAISVAMEFDDEKTAESIVTLMKLAGEEYEKYNIVQEGKKVVMHMDAKSFAEQQGISTDNLTKDSLKKELEKDGYTVE